MSGLLMRRGWPLALMQSGASASSCCAKSCLVFGLRSLPTLETRHRSSNWSKPTRRREASVSRQLKSILEGDGAAFDPAEFAQTVHQGGKPLAVGRARAWYEHADERLFRGLLGARRERPGGRCAAEKRYDLATPCMSGKEHCEG